MDLGPSLIQYFFILTNYICKGPVPKRVPSGCALEGTLLSRPWGDGELDLEPETCSSQVNIVEPQFPQL